MLSRSILGQGSALTRGALSTKAISRNISTCAAPRLSARALGKRPAIHFAMSAQAFSSRHLSWGAPNTHAEILKDPHPDLPSSVDSAKIEAVDPSRHDLSQSSTRPTDFEPFDTSNFTDPSTSSSTHHLTSTTTSPTHVADAAGTITPAAPGEHLSDLVALNPNVPLDDLLRSPEAASVITDISDLASIDLWHRFYSIPGWVADALVKLHDLTGLPW
jgi:hypothetical protein